MDTPSMESYLTGRPAEPPKPPSGGKGLLPGWLQTTLILAVAAGVGYLLYDGYQFQHHMKVEVSKLSDQIKILENRDKVGEAKLTDLQGLIVIGKDRCPAGARNFVHGLSSSTIFPPQGSNPP